MSVRFIAGREGAARSASASEVAIVGEWVLVPNVAPIDLQDDRVPLADHVEGQTLQIFANLDQLIAPLGLGREHVVRVTAYLANHERYFDRFDRIYRLQFPADRRPVRSCIGATSLTRGAQVVIDFALWNGAR